MDVSHNMFLFEDNQDQTITTEVADSEIESTTGVPDESTLLFEETDNQTTISNFDNETDIEIETTTTNDDLQVETTFKPFETTTAEGILDTTEIQTEAGTAIVEEINSETTISSIFEEFHPANQSLDVQVPALKHEIRADNVGLKTKVSKVIIFKRPIFVNSSGNSDMKIGQSNETGYDYGLNFIHSSLTEVAAKTIVYWRTSLLVILTVVLILSFTYHRRRIVKLKAEIIQKNLGSSYNSGFNQPSNTFPHSTNAYTPTYFPRRLAHNQKLPFALSDYDSSSRSRSNLYSQTYNSSFHSYESIIDLHSNDRFDADQMKKTRIDEDVESGEHIYAEIPCIKGSDDQKFGNDENNSATISEYLMEHILCLQGIFKNYCFSILSFSH